MKSNVVMSLKNLDLLTYLFGDYCIKWFTEWSTSQRLLIKKRDNFLINALKQAFSCVNLTTCAVCTSHNKISYFIKPYLHQGRGEKLSKLSLPLQIANAHVFLIFWKWLLHRRQKFPYFQFFTF